MIEVLLDYVMRDNARNCFSLTEFYFTPSEIQEFANENEWTLSPAKNGRPGSYVARDKNGEMCALFRHILTYNG